MINPKYLPKWEITHVHLQSCSSYENREYKDNLHITFPGARVNPIYICTVKLTH